MLVFPALFLTVTVLALISLGDILRDASIRKDAADDRITSTPRRARFPGNDAERAGAIRAAAQYAGEWLRHQAEVRGVSGMQIAIRHRGELVLELPWGVADVETGEPLRASHLFRVASQSKTMTATAVFQLFEAGALRLDDAAGQWIAELDGSPLAQVIVQRTARAPGRCDPRRRRRRLLAAGARSFPTAPRSSTCA